MMALYLIFALAHATDSPLTWGLSPGLPQATAVWKGIGLGHKPLQISPSLDAHAFGFISAGAPALP